MDHDVCLFGHRYIFWRLKISISTQFVLKYYGRFPRQCIHLHSYIYIYSFCLPDLFLLWDSSTPLQHALPACWTTRMIQGVSLNRSHNECDNRGLHYIIRFCFFEKRILQLHLIRQGTYFIYGLIHGRRTHGVLLQLSMTMICTKQL